MASVEIYKENLWPLLLPFENVANIDCDTFEESQDYFISEVRDHYSALSEGARHMSDVPLASVCAMLTTSNLSCFESEFSTPTYLCNFCNFDTETVVAVFDHVIKEHAFSCKLCNYTCFTKSGMVQHQLMFHEDDSDNMKGILSSNFIHLNLDRIQERLACKSDNTEEVPGTTDIDDYFSDSGSLRVRVHDIKQEPIEFPEDSTVVAGGSGPSEHGQDSFMDGPDDFQRRPCLQNEEDSFVMGPDSGEGASPKETSSKDAGPARYEHFLDLSKNAEGCSRDLSVGKEKVIDDETSRRGIEKLSEALPSFFNTTESETQSTSKSSKSVPLLQQILQQDKPVVGVSRLNEKAQKNSGSLEMSQNVDVRNITVSRTGNQDSKQLSSGKAIEEFQSCSGKTFESNPITLPEVIVKQEIISIVSGDDEEGENVGSECFDKSSLVPEEDKSYTLLRNLLENERGRQCEKESGDAQTSDNAPSSRGPKSPSISDMSLKDLLTTEFSQKRSYLQYVGSSSAPNSIYFVCGHCNSELKTKLLFAAHTKLCTSGKQSLDESGTHLQALLEPEASPSRNRKSPRLSTQHQERNHSSSSQNADLEVAESSDESESNLAEENSDEDWEGGHSSTSSRGADSSDEDFAPQRVHKVHPRKSHYKGIKALRDKAAAVRKVHQGLKSSDNNLQCTHCSFSSHLLAVVRHHLISNHLSQPSMAKIVHHGKTLSLMYFCRGSKSPCNFYSSKVEEIQAHIRQCYKGHLDGFVPEGSSKDFSAVLIAFAIATKSNECLRPVFYCLQCDFYSDMLQTFNAHTLRMHPQTVAGTLRIERGVREIRILMACFSCTKGLSLQEWWSHECRMKQRIQQNENVSDNPALSQSHSAMDHDNLLSFNEKSVLRKRSSSTSTVKDTINNIVNKVEDKKKAKMRSNSLADHDMPQVCANDLEVSGLDLDKRSRPSLSVPSSVTFVKMKKTFLSSERRSLEKKANHTSALELLIKDGPTTLGQLERTQQGSSGCEKQLNSMLVEKDNKHESGQQSSMSENKSIRGKHGFRGPLTLTPSFGEKTTSKQESLQSGLLHSLLTSPQTLPVKKSPGSSSTATELLKGLAHMSSQKDTSQVPLALQNDNGGRPAEPSMSSVKEDRIDTAGFRDISRASVGEASVNSSFRAQQTKGPQPASLKNLLLQATTDLFRQTSGPNLRQGFGGEHSGTSTSVSAGHWHTAADPFWISSPSVVSHRRDQPVSPSVSALQAAGPSGLSPAMEEETEDYPSTNLLRTLLTKQRRY